MINQWQSLSSQIKNNGNMEVEWHQVVFVGNKLEVM